LVRLVRLAFLLLAPPFCSIPGNANDEGDGRDDEL